MGESDLYVRILELMQDYAENCAQDLLDPCTQNFSNGATVEVSGKALRVLQIHTIVHDAADDWCASRLAPEGLEFVRPEG